MTHIKTAYNAAVAEARKQLTIAASLRKDLEAQDPSKKGKSGPALQAAIESAYKARTFAGVPLDLDKNDNPYAHLRGGRSSRGSASVR